MNPQLLTLALDTPLENLLGLPNGVEIALTLRDELAHYSPAQLHDILAVIDNLIATEHQTFRSMPGYDQEELLAIRELNRDIDWLADAISFQPFPRLEHLPRLNAQDLYRVLALEKLGAVIDATRDSDNRLFSHATIEDLLEATNALMTAKSPIETWEQALDKAWYAGLKPDPDVGEEVQEALSRTAQKAANIRHRKNRQAKAKALELYFGSAYSSIEVAAEIIAEQVFRAPGTVRKWIFEARQARGVSTK